MVKLPLKCRLIYLSQGTPGEVDVYSWTYQRKQYLLFSWACVVEVVEISIGEGEREARLVL